MNYLQSEIMENKKERDILLKFIHVYKPFTKPKHAIFN